MEHDFVYFLDHALFGSKDVYSSDSFLYSLTHRSYCDRLVRIATGLYITMEQILSYECSQQKPYISILTCICKNLNLETPSIKVVDTIVVISQSRIHVTFMKRHTGALWWKATLGTVLMEYNRKHNPVWRRKDKSPNPSGFLRQRQVRGQSVWQAALADVTKQRQSGLLW